MKKVAALGVLLAMGLSDAARAQEPAEPPPPRESLVEEDVDPELVVYTVAGVQLALGGLLQLHLSPYVGDDALIADDDPAGREGFRMRRARFGVDATFPAALRLLLVLNALENDPEVGAISEARVSWAPQRYFQIWAGADKVPFTRGELQSSAELTSIERPLTVRTLVPQRRLGVVVEGAVMKDKLSYAAGVMNATEGYEQGNQFSGLLYVARLAYTVRGLAFELSVGAGGIFEDGPATNVMAGSADLGVRYRGASLLVEGICDRTTPDDAPMTTPDVADEVKRCGAYAEAGYELERERLQAIARLEWLDDNTALDDAGDAWLVAAGVNWRVSPFFRAQLHYLGRYERESAERANDSVILSLQGEF
jgi:phosphate-selective porin